jgi:hypothetical protein
MAKIVTIQKDGIVDNVDERDLSRYLHAGYKVVEQEKPPEPVEIPAEVVEPVVEAPAKKAGKKGGVI